MGGFFEFAARILLEKLELDISIATFAIPIIESNPVGLPCASPEAGGSGGVEAGFLRQ